MSPVCVSQCADCGLGTIEAREWYMVREEVWERALAGRRKTSWSAYVPAQEILCVGCLEKRIGRTLMASDFTRAPVNDPFDFDDLKSDRLFNRLINKQGLIADTEMSTLDDFRAFCAIEKLPQDKRDAAWLAWKQEAPR